MISRFRTPFHGDKVAHVAPRGYFFLFFSSLFSPFFPLFSFSSLPSSFLLSLSLDFESTRDRCDTRSKSSIEYNENSTSRKRSGPRRKLEASSFPPLPLPYFSPSDSSLPPASPSFSHLFSLLCLANTYTRTSFSLSLSLSRREPHNTRVANLVDTSSTPTPRPLSSRLFSRVYQSCLVHRETRVEPILLPSLREKETRGL